MTNLPPVKRFITHSGVRIYRLPFRFLPDLSGRVYLLLGAGPPTLVDASNGRPDAIADVLSGMEAVRNDFNETFRPDDLKRILITHAHVDHHGGLAEWVQRTGADVGVHPLDWPDIAAFDERTILSRHRFEWLLTVSGVPATNRPALLEQFLRSRRHIEGVQPTFPLDDGLQLDGLQIIHTPGHSPGHVCILVDNVLLVGDHILARTMTQQWPESTGAYMGLGHYLESLAKVEAIPGIEVALGGHEPPIDDFYKRVAVVRASHLRRVERVVQVLRKSDQPLTTAELTERVYVSQASFYAFLAFTDIAARVEYLDQRGRLRVANLDQIQQEPDAAYRYAVV